MTDPISSSRNSLQPLQYRPWQPPPGWKVSAPAGLAADPVARMAGDRNQTGPLKLDFEGRKVDVEAIGAKLRTEELQATGRALAELGVASTLTQAAVAFSQTTFDPAQIADSLGKFASNLSSVTEQVSKLPGVGEALQTFGGVGGIVTGALGLKDELTRAQAEGAPKPQLLSLASSAARLVGGVAMALSPFAPPLAAVGASIMMAGAALELGKLGWEHRDDLKKAARTAAEVLGKDHAAGGLSKIIANNGANAVQVDVTRIVGNNGAAAVANPAWGWLGS